ncbi:MAG: hypothetical protein HYV02_05570 [Deltaproteobacteria bacterium]|nr:hypothetical protein [Deltaproteobacteria bacterium]
MELKSMPLDTAAEVLQFLSDHEEFDSLTVAMSEEMTRHDIKTMLRELAVELRKVAAASARPYHPKDDKNLTPKARKTLTCLSPMEEKTLLTAFGLIERR